MMTKAVTETMTEAMSGMGQAMAVSDDRGGQDGGNNLSDRGSDDRSGMREAQMAMTMSERGMVKRGSVVERGSMVQRGRMMERGMVDGRVKERGRHSVVASVAGDVMCYVGRGGQDGVSVVKGRWGMSIVSVGKGSCGIVAEVTMGDNASGSDRGERDKNGNSGESVHDCVD